MKILVTGGCGFIGSHLAERLAESNDVVVLDNLSSGKKERLAKNAEFIRGDIRDEAHVKKAARGCGAVFHLAAISDARAEDAAVFDTNFTGSRIVFEAAQRNGARVIFASSAAVYGNGKIPCSESDKAAPVSQYGKSKLKAEKLLMRQKEFFIARLFNVFGPGGNSAANRFCEMMPQYRQITVFGSGLQTRDYVYVTDVVDALVLGLGHTGIYNVGTGKETSLLQLIDAIHSVSGSKPDIKFENEKKGEIKRSRADISKIRKELGWEPKTALQEGIRLLASGSF